ncbi:M28 family peptidase [Cecembia calidifontis]|jgi:N-acetylated-alpha-linked acidic dipeptidase|uniref:N-acetylated-alpha-linked acidic dipeptidase n=1 Tax=Cecembia calidifontis TaxID=1187080 RepID=A0A4Q7PAF1_9BACT|nr:M28 family peptidase [Cecembia calidifontis]RZS97204.1 N-acetylated-alpha-linked acidic dipeptidase [Cecembia calidifontis]
MKKSHLLTLTFAFFAGFSLQAQTLDGFAKNSAARQKTIENQFKESVDFSRFKIHLSTITADPHPAGSAANEKVKDYMVETMQKAGWDVKVYPYDVYLTKGQGESLIELVYPIRKPLNQQEYIVDDNPYSRHPELKKGWNAFSGSGDVTAEVVYANYGTKADFEKLKELDIDIKGKIVLARYGANFRGYKAKFAEEYGAAGLIIFTDPADAGYTRGPVYPEGFLFNDNSIQRGSLLTVDWTGDALTPFEPALPLDSKTKIKRLDPKEVKGLHKIPVTPISYGSAQEILEKMKGKPVPAAWQGGLPFTYRLEGGPGLLVRLKVEQEKGLVRANNVVATLKGATHPDEWIILGCHYDAWSFGSTDPNSGTAMLLSMTETLGKLAAQGIRPSRSIMVAHWDAEEHGVIGSTEWVEQFRDELKAKAVAYINLDAAVGGRNFGASASPTLKKIIMDAAKEVLYPDSEKTVYEIWAANREEPAIGNLGGGSDHIAFYMHVGIPSINGGAGGPSLYHTNYDDMYFYEKFADPSFKMGGTVEQLIGIIAMRLANAELIPYELSRYPKDLDIHFANAEKEVKGYYGEFKGFDKSKAAIASLKESAASLESKISSFLESGNPDSRRVASINKDLMDFEKSFIDPQGMYFGNWYRSLYASTDPFSGYASWVLPGIQYEIELKSKDRLQEWDDRYSAAILDLKRKMDELNKKIN